MIAITSLLINTWGVFLIKNESARVNLISFKLNDSDFWSTLYECGVRELSSMFSKHNDRNSRIFWKKKNPAWSNEFHNGEEVQVP